LQTELNQQRITGEEKMKNFNNWPKTIKKTARYILQNADLEKLEQIEDILNYCINRAPHFTLLIQQRRITCAAVFI
jgi:hypothetical protein